MIKSLVVTILVYIAFVTGANAQKVPLIRELKLVSQLPAKVPQRANAIAFDGERFWVPLYLDDGRIVKFDPETETWDLTQEKMFQNSVAAVNRRWASPSGLVFVDGRAWLASSYGESYGWIEPHSPERFMVIESGVQGPWDRRKSFTDLAYDGNSIWMSWLIRDYYNDDQSKTQLLVRINKTTGGIEAEYSIPFGGLADGARGLTWDGANLWFGFHNSLRTLDQEGRELAQYFLPGVKRISGLAFDGRSLWVIEFDGKLWQLPFKVQDPIP